MSNSARVTAAAVDVTSSKIEYVVESTMSEILMLNFDAFQFSFVGCTYLVEFFLLLLPQLICTSPDKGQEISVFLFFFLLPFLFLGSIWQYIQGEPETKKVLKSGFFHEK